MEVLPTVMQALRLHTRARMVSGLTLSQLQIMSFVLRHPACRLGSVASQVGVGLPAASSTVARLLKQGLLIVETSPEDRRSAAISLTEEGARIVGLARERALQYVSERLSKLKKDERAKVAAALLLLKQAFLGPAVANTSI